MKATCPNCQTSYRVADDKVPEVGAQIKCPKCSASFVVRRPAGDAAEQPAQAGDIVPAAPAAQPPAEAPHQQSTPISDLLGGSAPAASAHQPPAVPDPPGAVDDSETPNLDALSGEAFVTTSSAKAVRASEETRSSARGVSAIRAQSKVGRAGRDLLEGFRVRTARGLTYDFPTRAALERWLAEREDLTGCEAAEPGGEWMPASALLKKVADPLKIPKAVGQPGQATQPAGPGPVPSEPIDPSRPIEVGHIKPVVSVLPGVPVGTRPGKRARSQAAFPGARAGWLVWTGLGLSLLLLAAAGVLSLTRYGVVDFSGVLPLDRLGVVFPGSGQDPGEVRLDAAPRLPAPEDPEAAFARALGQGRQMLRSKRFSMAALEFRRALQVHPGSVDALEGLAEAHTGLGDRERARQALGKAREIKNR